LLSLRRLSRLLLLLLRLLLLLELSLERLNERGKVGELG
jgi:hypothetical protein